MFLAWFSGLTLHGKYIAGFSSSVVKSKIFQHVYNYSLISFFIEQKNNNSLKAITRQDQKINLELVKLEHPENTSYLNMIYHWLSNIRLDQEVCLSNQITHSCSRQEFNQLDLKNIIQGYQPTQFRVTLPSIDRFPIQNCTLKTVV